MQALALDSNANEQRLLRKLAKLRKRAGKVRDLDVLTGYVAELEIQRRRGMPGPVAGISRLGT